MIYTWYARVMRGLSPDKIHQILAYGTLRDIKALKKNLGDKEIKDLFLKFPKKIYTNSSFNFIKNFILNIHTQVDEQKYLKHTKRRVR